MGPNPSKHSAKKSLSARSARDGRRTTNAASETFIK